MKPSHSTTATYGTAYLAIGLLSLIAFGATLTAAPSTATAGLQTHAAPTAQVRTQKEQRTLILMVLRAHEYNPKLSVFKRIGSAKDVTKILIMISGHKQFRAKTRVRAAAALALFPTQEVRLYLTSVVHERSFIGTMFGTLLRKQSLRSLGKAFGKEVVSDLAAVRTDTNAQIREGVAYALGDTGAIEAMPYLKGWLPNEKELFVRLAIDRSIDALRKRKR